MQPQMHREENQPCEMSRRRFAAAATLASKLNEDGYSWQEIEDIAHLLVGISRIQRKERLPFPNPARG